MYLRLLAGLLFMFSGTIYAYQFPLVIVEYIDNTKVVAYINESDIDKTLSWIPFEAPPPLTIADVVNDIQKTVASHPNLTNATLKKIELKQIPHHKNHWHYLVAIETKVNSHTELNYFAVLMNGKVIQLIKEPESYR